MYDQETGLVTRKSRCSAGGHLETQMIDTGDVYSVTATADTALDTLLVNEGSELPSAKTHCGRWDPVSLLAIMWQCSHSNI